ncbi:MAG: BamA/TamA family outer membrane protein [Elusimicrobiota bacterium]
MIKRALLAFLLLLGAAAAPRALRADSGDEEIIPNRVSGVKKAAEEVRAKEDETPAALRWMLQPLERGMFVRLPIIDTDPNRGITYGVMPIVVLQGKNDERIEQIHAPSITYNKDFHLSPTYRYYYYPEDDAAFAARLSRAKYESEVMAEYADHSFLGSKFDVLGRFQKNRDAGQRFFGLGPDSPKSGEANYIQDYWLYNWAVGVPFKEGSPFRARLSQRYIDSRILNGPIRNLPTFAAIYPGQFSDHAQQSAETRATLEYDTRDNLMTTTRGAYAQIFGETSVRGFLSQYDYERYGTDERWFIPIPDHPSHVIAVQGRYEQLLGPTPPFWLQSSMGGKYSLRAYGDGRYVDRGTATLNIEDRIKLYQAKTAGVTTEIQVAPFVGLGGVFDTPQEAELNKFRPVAGAAVRAVARPQVVGSVDFGIGREGLAVFTDINYSF